MIRFNDWTFDRRRLVIVKGDRQVMFRQVTANGKFKRNRRFMTIEHIALAEGHATVESIWNNLYAHMEDGGPLSYRNMVDVMFCQMHPFLHALGVRIVRERRASIRHFRFEDVV